MRTFSCLFFSLIALSTLSCNKQSTPPATPGSDPSAPGSGGSPFSNSAPAASVSVQVNGTPLAVTGISYNRTECTDGDLSFSAWNALQRVDVYCFYFYEQNGFNYQFSDSINYSTRPDTVTGWTTVRAINWGDVNFACCVAPLKDTVIFGQYSGNFAAGNSGSGKQPGDQQGLVVSGNFNLLFGVNHPGH